MNHFIYSLQEVLVWVKCHNPSLGLVTKARVVVVVVVVVVVEASVAAIFFFLLMGE
jgi:hypothetical protein